MSTEQPSLTECIWSASAEAERCETWAEAAGLSPPARAMMVARARVWRRTVEVLDLMLTHREDFIAVVRQRRSSVVPMRKPQGKR